jgi:hypothetical protein
MCRYRLCDGLIPRPRDPTNLIKETEKAAKVRQRAVVRQIDREITGKYTIKIVIKHPQT